MATRENSPDTLIETYHLGKRYGKFVAVSPLTFKVARGEIVGFLGPNGAGKSTTLRMLSGTLTPSSGSVLINGHPMHALPTVAKSALGYLPENAPLYGEMTPIHFLTFISTAHGIRGVALKRRVESLIAKLKLEPVARQPIYTLSKGYKRRVALAQALLNNPPVLILDEPTDGLDPEQKAQIYALLKEMSPYKAIILSTHMLEDVETICHRCLIISQGQLITDSTPTQLRRLAPDHNAITVSIPHAKQGEAQKAFMQLKFLKRLEWLPQEDECLKCRLYSDEPLQLHPDKTFVGWSAGLHLGSHPQVHPGSPRVSSGPVEQDQVARHQPGLPGVASSEELEAAVHDQPQQLRV